MGPIVAELVPRPGHVTRVALILALGAGVAMAARSQEVAARPSTPKLVEPSPLLQPHRCGVRQRKAQVPRELTSLIQRDQRAIDRCFRRAVADDAAIYHVQHATIVVEVDGAGATKPLRVDLADRRGHLAAPALEDCLGATVDAWTLSPSSSGTFKFRIAPPIDLAHDSTLDVPFAP